MRSKGMLVFWIVFMIFQLGLLPDAHATYQYPIITTDESGEGKFTFGLDENVYVTGGDFEGYDEVTVYVIPTGEEVTPENAVTEPVTATPIEHMSMNPLPTTLIWSAPLEPGDYDVWIDVNQNMQFERYVDEYRIFCCDYCFMVIPEFPVGPMGAFAAMLAAFMFFRRPISNE